MSFTKLPLDAATAAQGDMGSLSASSDSKEGSFFRDMIRMCFFCFFFPLFV